jgi:transcriptional regulator with XRE-family HTH domain
MQVSYYISIGMRRNLVARTKLGRRIRKLRHRKQWSQHVLASRCGINISHLGKIERGGTNATLSTLLAIAKNLQISISELFKGIP